MLLEISDPATIESLRLRPQSRGCPSERRGDDVIEVRALWSPDGPLSDADVRAKVVGAVHPGVKANVLS